MNAEYLPYLFLLLTVVTALAGWMRASGAFLVLAIGAGSALGRIDLIGVAACGALALSLEAAARRLKAPAAKTLSYTAFLVLAAGMSLHLVPGFQNFLVLDKVQFSSDSIPFTMYLNFDKTLVGLFLFWFFIRQNQKPISARAFAATVAVTLATLVLALLPLSLLMGYVRLEPKLPDSTWIWALNNLFFVCLAEEGLFRGFVQKGLRRLLPPTTWATAGSIAVGALLFGAAHYKGGPIYILLATIAGVFYGIAYQRTGRIEAAMLVHFGLNTIHFLLFSYPALIFQ